MICCWLLPNSAVKEKLLPFPIVLSTGYDEEDTASLLKDEALAGFIHKPYRKPALQGVIRDVLAAADPQ